MTLKPDFSRLAEKASKFAFGSGMYGRDTFVGYQKSTRHGTWQLDELSSDFALSGLYGYFGTLFVQPNSVGGWNSCATRSYPWTSPVWRAWSRAVLFEIGTITSVLIRGVFPQYFAFAFSTTFWPTIHWLKTYGPVPVGC